MSSITTRPISDAEILPACAHLLTDAYNAPPWHDAWTHEKALEKLLCFYQSPKFMGWTAWQDEVLIGCCVGNVEPYYTGDYFYLKEMFVSVQFQQRGAGTRLMAALRAELAVLDIRTIILFTGKDHFPFRFYQREGFAEMTDMRMMHLQAGEYIQA
ncbi:MAG: GNAT family N-acetyltransferase [Bacteroidia bacterium]|nr:GNAT family N-acetyltransferase [Bacteroidia bacterium]